MNQARTRRRAVVRGRVQGVGFRAFAAEHAARLGVRGTAENRPDGTVEVVVEGAPEEVERMLALLREGPYSARVDDVDVVEEPLGEPLPAMEVRW